MARIPNHTTEETKKHIESIFISLYKEKEINEISVTELCKKAKINRRTFYNHYEDIYILRKDIECEVITAFKAFYPVMLDSVINQNFTDEATEIIENFAKEYKEIILLFITIRTSKSFLETVRKYSSDCIQKVLPFYLDLSVPINRSIIEYISYGQMGIIIWWITEGQNVNIKDLAETINKIQRQGALNILQNSHNIQ